MDFHPFLDASLQIQIHAISALQALILGPCLLLARKGTKAHRIWGYIWVTNMALAIATSFFIHQTRMFGPFSVIHLLSIWGAITLVRAILAARAGDIRAHRGQIRGLYFGGVGVAAALAFLPGRVMNHMLFSEVDENLGFILIVAILLLLAIAILQGKRFARIWRNLLRPAKSPQ